MAPDRSDDKCWASARDLFGDGVPTDDDVPITRDGRRLDTPKKVRAFLAEIDAETAGRSPDEAGPSWAAGGPREPGIEGDPP